MLSRGRRPSPAPETRCCDNNCLKTAEREHSEWLRAQKERMGHTRSLTPPPKSPSAFRSPSPPPSTARFTTAQWMDIVHWLQEPEVVDLLKCEASVRTILATGQGKKMDYDTLRKPRMLPVGPDGEDENISVWEAARGARVKTIKTHQELQAGDPCCKKKRCIHSLTEARLAVLRKKFAEAGRQQAQNEVLAWVMRDPLTGGLNTCFTCLQLVFGVGRPRVSKVAESSKDGPIAPADARLTGHPAHNAMSETIKDDLHAFIDMVSVVCCALCCVVER